MSARRRYCCPRHGADAGSAYQALELVGDYYVIPVARGWFNALVKRPPGGLEAQEFPTEAQAVAWASDHPQVPLF